MNSVIDKYQHSLKKDPIFASISVIAPDTGQKALYSGDTAGWRVGTRIRNDGKLNFDSLVFVYDEVEFTANFATPLTLRISLDTNNDLIRSTDTYFVVEGDRVGRWFPITEILVGSSWGLLLLAMSVYVLGRPSFSLSQQDV
jgi:hypothetical protein